MANHHLALSRIDRATAALIDRAQGAITPPREIHLLKPTQPRTKWGDFRSPLASASVMPSLFTLPDDVDLGADVAHDILFAIGVVTGPHVDLSAIADPEGCLTTVGFIRGVLKRGETPETSLEDLIAGVIEVLEEGVLLTIGAERQIADIRSKAKAIEGRAARAHLPSYSEYDLLLRYQRSHERSIRELMAELRERQDAGVGGQSDGGSPVRADDGGDGEAA